MTQDFITGFLSATIFWFIVAIYFAYKAGTEINELRERLKKLK